MAIDRTRLPQPTRLILLEDFETDTDKWRSTVDTKMEKMTSRLDVMGAKIGVYAALGAVLGGGLVSGIVAAVFH